MDFSEWWECRVIKGIYDRDDASLSAGGGLTSLLCSILKNLHPSKAAREMGKALTGAECEPSLVLFSRRLHLINVSASWLIPIDCPLSNLFVAGSSCDLNPERVELD